MLVLCTNYYGSRGPLIANDSEIEPKIICVRLRLKKNGLQRRKASGNLRMRADGEIGMGDAAHGFVSNHLPAPQGVHETVTELGSAF